MLRPRVTEILIECVESYPVIYTKNTDFQLINPYTNTLAWNWNQPFKTNNMKTGKWLAMIALVFVAVGVQAQEHTEKQVQPKSKQIKSKRPAKKQAESKSVKTTPAKEEDKKSESKDATPVKESKMKATRKPVKKDVSSGK
jgi:hypothetical protein